MDIFVDKLYKHCEDSFRSNKCVIFSDDSMSCLLEMIKAELPEDILDIINIMHNKNLSYKNKN